MSCDRSELEILCPNCGATGRARVSANPEFRVEKYPDGFCEEQRSASCLETKVRCKCGQVLTQRFDAFERIGAATPAEIAEAQKLAPNKQPPQ
jgi:hypothetical protein